LSYPQWIAQTAAELQRRHGFRPSTVPPLALRVIAERVEHGEALASPPARSL
jgi:hypothetical protein